MSAKAEPHAQEVARARRKRRDDRIFTYWVICSLGPMALMVGALALTGFVSAWMELINGHGERPWDWLDGKTLAEERKNSATVSLWMMIPSISVALLLTLAEGAITALRGFVR